jgi:ferredoxin--NADP+ reductase
MTSSECNATIIYRENITDDLFVFRVKPDDGVFGPFEPGQYAEIALPEMQTPGTKLIRRQYSIASAPSAGDYVEFFIVVVPGGEVTPKLLSLKVGERLWLNPKPKGKFTLEHVEPNKDYIMIATGTGLAPFVSMLRQFKDSDAKPWRKLVIIHGVRFAKDLGYREELENTPNIIYLPATTREPENSEWKGQRGRVQQLLEKDRFQQITGLNLDPNECQVLLCGNPEMIDSVQAHLEHLNFKLHSKKSPGQIHLERYW